MLAESQECCLLSVTAHELRLPLSHIKGFVSTLQRRDVEWDEDTQRDLLAQIERETDRLAELISELLEQEHSGHRHGRSRHGKRAVTVAALVAGGLDRVRGLLGGRPVDVAVPPNVPMVRVDAPAIERVIANLVHNAIKYASANSHIRVAARASDDALELRVEDDGPGIPNGDRAHIFEQYYRGHHAEMSGRPGAGLGLSICLAIVEAHSGRIWADSRPGGGARFTVVLPLRADDAPRRHKRPLFVARRY